MGINQQALKAILAENNYRRIFGKVLLIGKSTVCLDRPHIRKLFKDNGLEAPEFQLNDKKTKHSSKIFDVVDDELIKCMSNDIVSIQTLDISPYEGADIIHDMNYPIDRKYFNQYDFIYDSSVMDNLFSPSTFILNTSALLKPGGRLISLNVASFFPGAMCSLHPEWYYGFFAINKFKDCRVYLVQNMEHGKDRFTYDTDLWEYKPDFTPNESYNYLDAVRQTNGICYSIVVAEKHANSTSSLEDFKYPTNLQYISTTANAVNWASADYHKFASDRPTLSAPTINTKTPCYPHNTDHYKYIGSGF